MIVYFGTLVVHIGSGMAAQQYFFVKLVKTVFVQVLFCCFVVKAPANAIMQHKQRQLEKKHKG